MAAPDAGLLFVYGTLRPGSDVPLARRLAAEARSVVAARAPGRLYDLGAYPGMTDGEPGEWVVGELYELDDPERVLAVLDDYEGCGPRDPLPHAFVRARRRVRCDDGTEREAWLYLAPRCAGEGTRISGGVWRG